MSPSELESSPWRLASAEAEGKELEWIRASLSPWWQGAAAPLRVRQLVPEGFETYLALPHGVGQLGHSAPEGILDPASLRAVLEVVASSGSAGRTTAWCAFWNGWGELHRSLSALLGRSGYADAELGAASVDFDFYWREYVGLTGAASGLGRLLESPHAPTPQMSWSEDRSWFLASEIDLAVSILGCSAEVSGELLARSHSGASILQRDDPIPSEWLD